MVKSFPEEVAMAEYANTQLNEAVCTLAARVHCRLIFNKLLCNESTPNT
jgi:hypothetical protein